VIFVGLLALAVSIYCAYVGLSTNSAGAAGVGGLCIVASLYLIVEERRRL
jgi:hypothetical protein